MSEKSPSGSFEPRRAYPLEEVRKARGEARVAVPRSKLVAVRPFRRIRPDRIYGTLGMFLLVAGIFATLNWERPTPPTPTVTVEYVETSSATVNETVLVTETQRLQTVTLLIESNNVSRVTFFLNSVDDVGDSTFEWDHLVYTLTGPPKSNVSKAQDVFPDAVGKNFTFDISVVELPIIQTLPVATVAEAMALVGDYTTDNGTGEWRLDIELVDARDDFVREEVQPLDATCPDSSAPTVCRPDTEQIVNVRYAYATYRADFRLA